MLGLQEMIFLILAGSALALNPGLDGHERPPPHPTTHNPLSNCIGFALEHVVRRANANSHIGLKALMACNGLALEKRRKLAGYG